MHEESKNKRKIMKKLLLSFLILYSSIFIVISIEARNRSGKRVAVVGGGVSGLVTTWLIEQEYEVTLFEQQDRLGGHANTVNVAVDGMNIPIDAGAEFFSDPLFPHFNRLLQILNVAVNKYPLTYTFYTVDGSEIILLPAIRDAQSKYPWDTWEPHNILNMLQFKYIIDEGSDILKNVDTTITFQKYIDSLPLLTNEFKNNFLYPLLAGGWGASVDNVKGLAAYDLLKWFATNIPQGLTAADWNEVVGGMSVYVKALAQQLVRAKVKTSANIIQITYNNTVYTITEKNGTVSQFDHLVLATNATQAQALLKDIPETTNLQSVLGTVDYFHTTIAVHGDLDLMPSDKAGWSVVNVRYDGINSAISVHKPWKSPTIPIFRSWITYDVEAQESTLNNLPQPLYALEHYDHPLPTPAYFEAQKAIALAQGTNNLWFVGMYTYDIDTHEDAIMSAVRIAQQLCPTSARLQQLTTV